MAFFWMGGGGLSQSGVEFFFYLFGRIRNKKTGLELGGTVTKLEWLETKDGWRKMRTSGNGKSSLFRFGKLDQQPKYLPIGK